jgi:hypothetical protein
MGRRCRKVVDALDQRCWSDQLGGERVAGKLPVALSTRYALC